MNFSSYGWWMFAGVLIGVFCGYYVNQPAKAAIHIAASASVKTCGDK